jgi:hypothetical protein
MTSWKTMLGLGAACAACCALPLLGVAGGIAAFGTALWACIDEVAPLAAALVAAAILGGGWLLWRRRATRRERCACTGACATSTSGGERCASRTG